jgi:ribosomal protein L39E
LKNESVNQKGPQKRTRKAAAFLRACLLIDFFFDLACSFLSDTVELQKTVLPATSHLHHHRVLRFLLLLCRRRRRLQCTTIDLVYITKTNRRMPAFIMVRTIKRILLPRNEIKRTAHISESGWSSDVLAF